MSEGGREGGRIDMEKMKLIWPYHQPVTLSSLLASLLLVVVHARLRCHTAACLKTGGAAGQTCQNGTSEFSLVSHTAPT